MTMTTTSNNGHILIRRHTLAFGTGELKKICFPPCGFVLTVFHYLSFFYFLYYGTQRSTKSGIKNLLDITNNVYNESYLFCLGALLYWYIRSFLQNYVIQSELDKERFPQSTTDTHLSGMLHN